MVSYFFLSFIPRLTSWRHLITSIVQTIGIVLCLWFKTVSAVPEWFRGRAPLNEKPVHWLTMGKKICMQSKRHFFVVKISMSWLSHKLSFSHLGSKKHKSHGYMRRRGGSKVRMMKERRYEGRMVWLEQGSSRRRVRLRREDRLRRGQEL